MKVYKSTGKTQSRFQNQDYFNDFNWNAFIPGDIVWLEDYTGEVEKIAGVFTGFLNETEPVVRLLPNRDATILARNNSESILSYKTSYWERYL